MLSYIVDHWKGRHSPARSLILNGALPLVFLLGLQSLWLDESVARGHLGAILVVSLLASIYMPLFVWQLVGANRSAQQRPTAGSLSESLILNALLLSAFFYVVLRLLDLATSENSHGIPRPLPGTGLAAIEPTLKLSLYKPPYDNDHDLTPEIAQRQSRLMSLSGEVGIAATREVRAFLKAQPGIEGIVLDSVGGNIFEARGIAKVIRDQQLTTHVDTRCYSACTLMYVSGHHRSAGPRAEFGFHAYRVDSRYPDAVILDTKSQQQKDMTLFEQSGVAQDFVQKIYQSEPDQLWTPELGLLLEAGFVHTLE